MSFQSALRDALANHPEVAPLVADRIYPRRLPEGWMAPAITYFRVSSSPVLSQEGVSLDNPRIQIDCWANDPDTAEELSIAVRHALAGRWPTSMAQSAIPISDQNVDDPDTLIHHWILEFSFYAEAA